MNGFNAPITITADTEGLPVTAQLNPATIPAGSTSSQLTVTVATTIAPGLYDGRGPDLTVALHSDANAEVAVANGSPTLTLDQSYSGSTQSPSLSRIVPACEISPESTF
jgi:hypothetical protein